jgi:hypothetical protein
MAKAYKLERLVIPAASRTVKDWFPTRESADAAIPAIRAHIKSTGETYTCFCHTHTKPDANAVPIYIGDFELPDRVREAKHFSPCPCCWDEFGKFGHGKIAWFPDERVIRLIGPDCFAALNPEGHAKAQAAFEIEQEQKRNTDFLLSNLPRLAEVVSVIERAATVADAIETFHAEMQGKLSAVKLNLWQQVRRDGELTVTAQEKEFRRGDDGEMYSHDVEVQKVFARLPGYQMLDPVLDPLSASLRTALGRIEPYNSGQEATAVIEAMSDEKRREVAEILSRSVKRAKEKIAHIETLRKFTERVAINTLRNWGEQEGCPISCYCSHEGDGIAFGKRQHQTVNVALPANIRDRIGQIEFWVEREPRRR